MKVWVAQSCPTLCDLMDWGPPGSSVRGDSPDRNMEWGAISFFRGSSWLRDQTWVSCTAGRFFTIWASTIVIMFYSRGSDLIQLMAETLFRLLPISLHSQTPPPNLPPPGHGNQFSILLENSLFWELKVFSSHTYKWYEAFVFLCLACFT